MIAEDRVNPDTKNEILCKLAFCIPFFPLTITCDGNFRQTTPQEFCRKRT